MVGNILGQSDGEELSVKTEPQEKKSAIIPEIEILSLDSDEEETATKTSQGKIIFI